MALADSGRVVVIEVKRDVDRVQLAQCLNDAGWARPANLDEVSELSSLTSPRESPRRSSRTGSPTLRSRTPSASSGHLVSIASQGTLRNEPSRPSISCIRRGSPWKSPVSTYVDPQGRRIVDIESDREPTAAASSARPGSPTAARTAAVVGVRAVRHDQQAIAAPEALRTANRMASSPFGMTASHE